MTIKAKQRYTTKLGKRFDDLPHCLSNISQSEILCKQQNTQYPYSTKYKW